MADSFNLSNMVSNAENNMTKAAANIGLGPAAPTNNPINPISSGPPPLTSSGSGLGFKEFLESNNLVAKVSFLLLVIFIFIIILQLGVRLLVYFFDVPSSPYLIDGMIKGTELMSIPQDPSQTGAKPLQRSVDGPDGIEFTWSIWIYIENLPLDPTKYSHIFSKGNSDISQCTSKNTYISTTPNNSNDNDNRKLH